VVVSASQRNTGIVRVVMEECAVELGELTAASAEWVALLARALREGR
jgi:hypothetical protein